MAKISFNSENLKVDWISFNLKGLANTRIIADRLSNYFTPHVTIDGKPEIEFHDFREKYKVSIHQYTGSKGYWIGTKISFSGKNANYFYKLLKTQDLDWSLLKFKEDNISLGRIDLYFSLMNDLSQTNKSFDKFLVDCRSHIQDHTSTKYIKLQYFPDGKMLKVNRRNNSRHYRVYQKETFFSSDKHSYEVIFIHYDYIPKAKSFWEGIKIDFTDKNAEHFYNQIKKDQLDRKIFDFTKLIFARIDLYYLRHTKPGNTNQSVKDFMELSRRRVSTKDKRHKVSWDYEEDGLVYRVGIRGSKKYYRIYQTDSAHNPEELKFEFESKSSRLLEKLLINNSIQ